MLLEPPILEASRTNAARPTLPSRSTGKPVRLVSSHNRAMDSFTFTRALTRIPGPRYTSGLARVDLGTPDVERAIEQHRGYCDVLAECGLTVEALPADDDPDSTFVEDTAVIVDELCILTRPGVPSRAAEVDAIEEILRPQFENLVRIREPGTLDGGDVCWAGENFFVGLSARTNPEGARQLADHLVHLGCATRMIDIRGVDSLLHLKSGMAALEKDRLVVVRELAGDDALEGYSLVAVPSKETYAANCVRLNDSIVMAGGFPQLATRFDELGYNVRTVDMSEFALKDGGPSCLSLRFQ